MGWFSYVSHRVVHACLDRCPHPCHITVPPLHVAFITSIYHLDFSPDTTLTAQYDDYQMMYAPIHRGHDAEFHPWFEASKVGYSWSNQVDGNVEL